MCGIWLSAAVCAGLDDLMAGSTFWVPVNAVLGCSGWRSVYCSSVIWLKVWVGCV